MREMCMLAVENSEHDVAWETRTHRQRLPGGRCVIHEELQVNVITWMLSDEPALGSQEAGGFLGTTRAKTLCNLFICSHIHILLITVLFPGPCTCTILQYLSPKLQTAIAHSILNRFLSFLECGLAFI